MEWVIASIILFIIATISLFALVTVFTNSEQFFGKPEIQIKEIVPQDTVSIERYNHLREEMSKLTSAPDWRKLIDPKYADRYYLEFGFMEDRGGFDITRWGGGFDLVEARNIYHVIEKQQKLTRNTPPPITLNSAEGINALAPVDTFFLNGLWCVVQSLAYHYGDGAYIRYVRLYMTSTQEDVVMASQLMSEQSRDFVFPAIDEQMYDNGFINEVIETSVRPSFQPMNSGFQQQGFMRPNPVNNGNGNYQPAPAFPQPQFQPSHQQPAWGGGYNGGNQGGYGQPVQQPNPAWNNGNASYSPYNPNVNYNNR